MPFEARKRAAKPCDGGGVAPIRRVPVMPGLVMDDVSAEAHQRDWGDFNNRHGE